MTKHVNGWPVDSNGAIVTSGSGKAITGYLPEGTMPIGNDGGVLLPNDRGISAVPFGVVMDGVTLIDVVSTATNPSIITSASGQFSSADVGKVCTLLSYAAEGGAAKFGTILSVQSSTSCTVQLNSVPAALSGATLCFGTDNKVGINAALVEAKSRKTSLVLGSGIALTTGSHVIPTTTALIGVGNNPTGGKARDFAHTGTTLVLAADTGNFAFITLGDTPSNTKGAQLRDLNLDCMNLTSQCLNANTRTCTVSYCSVVRGRQVTYSCSATANTHSCSFLGDNINNVVELTGDSRFISNIVAGAGATFYNIKIANADDILISNNHTWKDSTNSSLFGGQIFISQFGGEVKAGSITIIGNKFDTSFGPHIYVKASGGSILRGVNIVGNHGFQNDNVPNNTYPWMKVETDASSSIRGLNVHNNSGRGSWNDGTKGTITALIDGSANAGAVVGSSVTGNMMDNCAAGYASFTPTTSANNVFVAGVGTVATVF